MKWFRLPIARDLDNDIRRSIRRYFGGIPETDHNGSVPAIHAIDLKWIEVSDITIKKHLFKNKLEVTITARYPGHIIGRKGETVYGLMVWLSKLYNKTIFVVLKEKNVWYRK